MKLVIEYMVSPGGGAAWVVADGQEIALPAWDSMSTQGQHAWLCAMAGQNPNVTKVTVTMVSIVT